MILTSIEPEDLDLLYTIENNPSLWSVSSSNVPYSRYALRDYIATQLHDIYADKQVRLVARVEETDADGVETKAVGLVDLFNFSPENLRAEIGIAILAEEQHKGYGKEAVRQLLNYAREVLHLHVVYAIVPEDNTSSISMLRATGFSQTAMLKDWILRGDGWHDAIYLQIILQ